MSCRYPACRRNSYVGDGAGLRSGKSPKLDFLVAPTPVAPRLTTQLASNSPDQYGTSDLEVDDDVAEAAFSLSSFLMLSIQAFRPGILMLVFLAITAASR